jgi:hypothetical protein
MNLRVPYKGENLLKRWATTNFSIVNFFSPTDNWLVTRSRQFGCKHLHSLISAKIYSVSRLWLVVPNITASYGLQKPRGVEWHRSTPCSSTECFFSSVCDLLQGCSFDRTGITRNDSDGGALPEEEWESGLKMPTSKSKLKKGRQIF